jgi:hypothetical protein
MPPQVAGLWPVGQLSRGTLSPQDRTTDPVESKETLAGPVETMGITLGLLEALKVEWLASSDSAISRFSTSPTLNFVLVK